jgi:predicted O-methyltransferase YrrM
VDFDSIARSVAGVPFMSPEEGRIIFDHVSATRPRWALELGTAHGVGAAYIAAALPPEGRLITVDHSTADWDPSPANVLAGAGVANKVEIVREYSSYTWWLKTELERVGSAPRFDFAFLDGAKNWTIDGLAVLLLERVLRPGGWLLMDDLYWTYDDRETSDGITVRALSQAERTEPHLRAVFDLLIAGNPAWTDLRVQNDWWAWARRLRDDEGAAPQRVAVETTQSVGALAATAFRRGARAIQRRAQRRARAQGGSS